MFRNPYLSSKERLQFLVLWFLPEWQRFIFYSVALVADRLIIRPYLHNLLPFLKRMASTILTCQGYKDMLFYSMMLNWHRQICHKLVCLVVYKVLYAPWMGSLSYKSNCFSFWQWDNDLSLYIQWLLMDDKFMITCILPYSTSLSHSCLSIH